MLYIVADGLIAPSMITCWLGRSFEKCDDILSPFATNIKSFTSKPYYHILLINDVIPKNLPKRMHLMHASN